MISKKRLIILIMIALLTVLPNLIDENYVHAEEIFYITFANAVGNADKLTFTGSENSEKGIIDNALQLTGAGGDQLGAVFFKEKVKADSGFSTSFKFEFTDKPGGAEGADGMVFILSKNSNVCGIGGYGMGYTGINNSVGIEFDTYCNPESEDSDSHIAAYVNGQTGTNIYGGAYYDLGADYFDDEAADYYAWVDYDAASDNMQVRVNKTNDRAGAVLALDINIDISLYASEEYYVGFTAATGGDWQKHRVLEWYFDNDYHADGLDPEISYSVDTTKPTSPSITDNGNLTYSIDGSTDGESGIAYYEYKINAGIWNSGTSYDLSSSADGDYTIEARAIDNVGNISDVSSLLVTKDTEGPTAPTVDKGTGVYTSSVAVTVSTAGDAANTYYTTNGDEPNDSSTELTNPITIDAAHGGSIQLKVVSYDVHGNKSSVLEENYTFDKEAPNTQDDVLSENISINSNQSITINPSGDSTNTVWIAPEGTLEFVESGSMTKTSGNNTSINAPLLEGNYRVYVVDDSGNVSQGSKAVITVDDTSPTITIKTAPTEWTNEDVTVTTIFNEEGSGVSSTKYAKGIVDAGYFMLYGTEIEDGKFKVSQNSTYTVYVSDNSDNEAIDTIEITNIDKTNPPKPSIIKDPDKDFYNDSFVIFISAGLDEGSGLSKILYRTGSAIDTKYRTNGAIDTPWTEYEGPITISEEGETKIETKSIDKAGNESAIEAVTVIINREIDVFVKIEIDPDKEFSNEGYTVTLVKDGISDETINASQVYYKYTGISDFITYTEPFVITEEGEMEIQVKIIDREGNELVQTKTVMIDKTSPNTQNQVLKDSITKRGGQPIQIQPTKDANDTIWIAPGGTTVFKETNTMTKASTDAVSILVPVEEGKYRLYVVDIAGNVSDPSDAIVTVDNTPPSVNVENAMTYKEYITIYFGDGTAMLNGEPFENGSIINENGIYTLMVVDAYGNAKTLTFTVDNDEEWVNKDRDAIEIVYVEGDSNEHVTANIGLPTEGQNGSQIIWSSSDENVITTAGEVITPKQETEIILTANIIKGNASITQTYVLKVVADIIKPEITLLGESAITIQKGELYIEKGVICIDNEDGDISDKVEIKGFVDTSVLGKYTLVYKGMDSSGNTAQIQRTVTVIEKPISTESTINVDNDGKIDDEEIADAIESAKQNKEEKVVIIVEKEVETQNPVKVNISKEQVENAQKKDIDIAMEANNASIKIPINEIDTERMSSNSRLELICEKVDIEAEENKQMVDDDVKAVNQSMAIYEHNIYDFSMKLIEEDEEGNIVNEEKIENFKTENEEIILRIVVGKEIDEDIKLMTFYYNEERETWEYVKGEYEEDLGTMKFTTSHLSIYSVMYLTQEEKQQEMVAILNEEDVTTDEVLNIIEDIDMDFESEVLSQYNMLTDNLKNDIAQEILEQMPEEGYTYETLKEMHTELVAQKYNIIGQDDAKPVIKLIGNSLVRIPVNSEYIEFGATAEDNLDGDITGRIMIIGEVDTTDVGGYTLRYTVQDLNGNEADKVIRKVIVYSLSDNDDDDDDDDLVNEIEKQILSSIDQNEGQIKIIGNLHELDYKEDNRIENVIEIEYDESKVENELHLCAYVYDEESGEWHSIGGVVNPEEDIITIKVINGDKIAITEYTKTFEDTDNHWAKDEIEILASRRIVDGDGNGYYHPNTGITRAEFATLITKILRLRIEDADTMFLDVQEDAWYAPYIASARKAGVVKGISETEYAPNRIVNREEMTTMLIRAYQLQKDIDIEVDSSDDVEKFTDDEEISDWAKDKIYKAKILELIKGRTKELFAPKEETLRGEAAVLVYRFLQALGEI
ncbi:MAG: DUF5011 domain-containing protein [Clostridia bacterium]|nr:DUF5011 domain-containing protein [Clostridia bacterium]